MGRTPARNQAIQPMLHIVAEMLHLLDRQKSNRKVLS